MSSIYRTNWRSVSLWAVPLNSDPIVQSVDINTKSTSYAGAAGASAKDQSKVNSNFRTLVADLIFDGVNISIPRKIFKKEQLRETWAERIMMNSKGFFFFKFDSWAVLEGGPWLIHKSLIILKKGSIDFRLFKEELTHIPIWVKLHNVPIQVFEEDEADLMDVVTIGIPSFMGMVSPKKPSVLSMNGGRPDVIYTNDGFRTVGKKKKRKGKSKSTNGGQFAGPLVKQNIRYEPKATISAPKKGVTNVGNTSQSSSMLKMTGNSSKKDILSMSNSFSALNDEEQDDEEDVEIALMNSMHIDELVAKGKLDLTPTLRKRSHNDQDPPENHEGKNKKRRQKNIGGSSLKKDKALVDSSNFKRGKHSNWFKQPNEKKIEERPEKRWFNELVDADKDPREHELQIGSTIINNIELEYNLEQCYLAMKNKIDWKNPKANRFHDDLSKLLPLEGPPGRKTIPIRYFFNNELEYLMHGNPKKKYELLLSKVKAARYEQERIEEMIPYLWSSSIQKLNQNDIKDLYLLKIQDKIHNIDGVDEYDLINALLLYIRRIVIRKRVKDVQLGEESYQTKLKLTKPKFNIKGLHLQHLYTTMSHPKEVVYLGKDKQKMLMRADELHKFNDGTLNKVYEKLDVMLKDNVLGYGNEGLKNHERTKMD
ncbi:zinc knuckle CX2CX4HX4C containing protein [Tanacetum coccineum]